MTRSRQTADWGSRAGLAKVIPSSVAVGSGTGSADSLGTVTYSGVSSVSLNGVFTSTYNRYRIEIIGSTHSATSNLQLNYRYSGTNDSQNVHYTQICTVTQSGSIAGSAFNPSTSFVIGIGGTGVDPFIIVERQLARITGYGFSQSSDGSFGHRTFSGKHNNMNQTYDGFTLSPSTGTMSGEVRVYGYN